MKPGVRDGRAQICIHDSRLDDGSLVFDVHFKDAIHLRENRQNAATPRQRAAR